MPDIYAETVRKMSDYILSRLDGSSEECKRVIRDVNPSRYYIIGSLANVVKKDGVQKSSVQESAITLKFKLKEAQDVPIHITYSVFCKDKLTAEEANFSNAKHAWNRIDFSESFTLSSINRRHKLSFQNSSYKVDGYDAAVDYLEEIFDDGVQITICIHNDSISEYSDRYMFNTKMEVGIGQTEIIQYRYEYYYEGLKKVF